MSKAVADSVRGRCRVVAVSDSFRLAPWADALASTDSKWWKANEAAFQFAGRRVSAAPDYIQLEGVERFPTETHTNSGLLGIKVAVHLGATRVMLCGVDLHSPGQHFFGRHPAPLRSSEARHMEIFKRQFAAYKPRGIDIVNCSPMSALTCYEMGDLETELARLG